MTSPDWRDWPDEKKALFKARLARETEARRTLWWASTCKPDCDGKPHPGAPARHGRGNQQPPSGSWFEWMMRSGRGFGKTRGGSEFVRDRVNKIARRVALVGRTAADVRDVMIEGDSGLLSVFPKWERPDYQPTKRRVTFYNGAQAFCYSSEEPDQLRGPQHDTAWLDEAASFYNLGAVLANYRMGLRLGPDPRAVITSTPRTTPEVRKLLSTPGVIVTGGSSYDNLDNLAPVYRERVLSLYEGTRLATQEIYGLLLEDVEGALWSQGLIDQYRIAPTQLPELVRVVVGVDPAVTSGEDADETGIVVVGKGIDGDFYVIEDKSGRFTPEGWAAEVSEAYRRNQADRVIAETNNGGDLVVSVINATRHLPVKKVTASRGKRTRAEPISALYEQGRVHHVGSLAVLEDQMATWTPGVGTSPDRMDALVWACTELGVGTARRGRVSAA